MRLDTELAAYQSAVNLPLLNDIIAFVRDTSKADGGKRAALRRRCVLLDNGATGSAFQEKYGFLYLGELLERYEERFGMPVRDFRAIALALAYARDMTDGSMFVGPQLRDFLGKLADRADGDVYLTGALYLLEGPGGPHKKALYEAGYAATEEALFALSLVQEQDRAFSRFKPLLLRLLGTGRTMPALGNAALLDWFLAWLAPRVKAERGKDMALFRALAALPVSFVKPGGKPHAVLLDHGWTPLEIAYANMAPVLSPSPRDAVHPDSLVAERIAVGLFREVLSGDALPPPMYGWLSELLDRYARFRIKCDGCGGMLDALKDGPRIRDPDTFLWFVRHAGPSHPAFEGFDVLDAKWGPLASAMEPAKYLELFECSLTDRLDAAAIRARIARYDALTGGDYLAAYREGGNVSRFGLLVDKGVLDPWRCFRDSLDGEGFPAKPCMIDFVRHYLDGLSTIQAYRFYERFFEAYPALALERYFGYNHRDFFRALTDSRSYYGNHRHEIELRVHRDFLDGSQERRLLGWLEEYVFAFTPDQYPAFAEAILRDEGIAALFPMDEQKALFRMVIRQPALYRSTADELKRRYMSGEELQAERDAEAAAEREAALRRALAGERKVEEAFGQKFDGTFASAAGFLEEYRYRREEARIACRVVHGKLRGILERNGYVLAGGDAAGFLLVCGKLAREGAMPFSEAQAYISALKEREEDAG